MENFPSNSHEPKAPIEEKPAKERILKVVEGTVTRRKKPLSARVREMFIPDTDQSVFDYVFADVLVPAFKDMVNDAVKASIERVLFGDSKHSSSTKPSAFGRSNPNRVPYNRYSSDTSRREPSRRNSRSSHSFDDIILSSRSEAEKVIDDLQAIIEKYEIVSVSALYELVGEEFHHTDEKWGWSDLSRAGVRRVGSGGYLLDLPPTEPID